MKNWQRWPSAAARQSLEQRFGFLIDPEMQDWEWVVANHERITEFLAAFRSGHLSDDERFSLMEILIQSIADLELPSLDKSPEWKETEEILRANPRLHASTIHYWSGIGADHGWPQVGDAMLKLWREVESSLA